MKRKEKKKKKGQEKASKHGWRRATDLAVLLLLLQNEANNKGDTPLHCICRHQHEGILLTLLDSGARPCLANHHGCTPLHIAAYRLDDEEDEEGKNE